MRCSAPSAGVLLRGRDAAAIRRCSAAPPGWCARRRCCALRFGRGAPVGLLCIGTRKPGRFHPGLGTELLSFLARVVGITIAQWLNPRG